MSPQGGLLIIFVPGLEGLGGIEKDCERLGRIGRDLEELRKIGRDWEGLGRIGKDWEGLRKIGKDWEGDEGDSASVRGNLGKGRCKAAIRRPQDLPLQPFNGQWLVDRHEYFVKSFGEVLMMMISNI